MDYRETLFDKCYTPKSKPWDYRASSRLLLKDKTLSDRLSQHIQEYLTLYNYHMDLRAMAFVIKHFESCSADFLGDFVLLDVPYLGDQIHLNYILGIECRVYHGQEIIEPGVLIEVAGY